MEAETLKRVLIVEDEPLLLEVSSDAFADAGYEVVAVGSGDQGLDVLEQRSGFDLLFTDIRMPGKTNGWAMATQARRLLPGIAVIYATGYAEDDGGMVAGSVLIKKPYRMGAVLDAAGSLIGGTPG